MSLADKISYLNQVNGLSNNKLPGISAYTQSFYEELKSIKNLKIVYDVNLHAQIYRGLKSDYVDSPHNK